MVPRACSSWLVTVLARIGVDLRCVVGVLQLLRRPGPGPAAEASVVSWAGMRGVVTLAAVFLLPADQKHERDLIALIAFTVVAGTLLIQGLTLPLLCGG